MFPFPLPYLFICSLYINDIFSSERALEAPPFPIFSNPETKALPPVLSPSLAPLSPLVTSIPGSASPGSRGARSSHSFCTHSRLCGSRGARSSHSDCTRLCLRARELLAGGDSPSPLLAAVMRVWDVVSEHIQWMFLMEQVVLDSLLRSRGTQRSETPLLLLYLSCKGS